MTVCLATGWLLTVANTGDSAAVLDTGSSMLELIKSHRIHSNLEEQARLKQAGQYLAPLGFHLQVRLQRWDAAALRWDKPTDRQPLLSRRRDEHQGRHRPRRPQGPAKPGEQGVGPLRLWPGGLCVSRSIGDLDAGAEVVPVPHIRQVRASLV